MNLSGEYYIIQLDTTPSFDSGNVINRMAFSIPYTPVSPLSDATWHWRVQAVDAGGNPSPFSSSNFFIIDTLSPVFFNGSKQIINYQKGTPGKIRFKVTDPHPRDYQLFIDSILWEYQFWYDELIQVSIEGCSVGQHTANLTAWDQLGNYNSILFTVNVQARSKSIPAFDALLCILDLVILGLFAHSKGIFKKLNRPMTFYVR